MAYANTLRTLIVALALCAGAGANAQHKVGHVDRTQLMLALPERAAAQTKLEAFAKTLEARLKAMGDEYTSKAAVLQNPPAGMTGTEMTMAQRELQELEARIGAAQERAQEDLARMEQELMQPMVTKVTTTISEVAAAHGFAYILDSAPGGYVLFAAQGEDILPLVKAKLNIP
ncbi:MAG: OmpH family outer membrane protein [Flavobacteriales bacterium]|nr:OmpH family outer membrane protein [Flavobacteriales bacterium]